MCKALALRGSFFYGLSSYLAPWSPSTSQEQWYMTAIPASEKLRQVGHEFKASLLHIVGPHHKTNNPLPNPCGQYDSAVEQLRKTEFPYASLFRIRIRSSFFGGGVD